MTSRVLGRLQEIPKLAWTAIVVLPFVFIILLSFRSTNDILTDPINLASKWLPGNFSQAWQGPEGGTGFSTYFRNTLIVATVGITVSLIAAAPAAYFSALLPAQARRRVLIVPLIATIVPILVLLIPFFQILNTFGLLSSPVILGIIYAGLALPSSILILNPFFVDFPMELRDAAAIDGLGAMQTFARVVLPVSKAPLAAVALVNFVWMWGETQIGIVILQDVTSQTVPVGVLAFQGQYATDFGPLFASLTIATLPIMIVYLVFSRHVTKGLALGGVSR